MSTNPGMGSESMREGTFEGQATERVREGARNVAESARGVAEAVMGGHTEELKDELGRIGHAAKDAAYEQMEHLRQAGLDRARQLEERIQEQPLKSVLISAGIGFILGVLWMRE